MTKIILTYFQNYFQTCPKYVRKLVGLDIETKESLTLGRVVMGIGMDQPVHISFLIGKPKRKSGWGWKDMVVI